MSVKAPPSHSKVAEREERWQIGFWACVFAFLVISFIAFMWFGSTRLVCFEPDSSLVKVNGKTQGLGGQGCFEATGLFGSETIDVRFPNGIHRKVLLTLHPGDDSSSSMTISQKGVDASDLDMTDISTGADQ